jgi:O-6-methylguanine DNA methyltransferase
LTAFNVALHLPGSEFSRQVWAILATIPYGQTTTYGAIAARLGKPGASRAVGLANGHNRLSIVLPCHRVIGADGSLTGYGGGQPRKAFLLRLEKAAVQISLPFAHDEIDTPVAAFRECLKPCPTAINPPPISCRQSMRTGGNTSRRSARACTNPTPPAIPMSRWYGRLPISNCMPGPAMRSSAGCWPCSRPGGFPRPEQIVACDFDQLRGCGFSASKIANDSGHRPGDPRGVVPDYPTALAMDDEALIERLVTLRGVGRWTVEMLLIYSLERPDIRRPTISECGGLSPIEGAGGAADAQADDRDRLGVEPVSDGGGLVFVARTNR